jgi:hypothetical protein
MKSIQSFLAGFFIAAVIMMVANSFFSLWINNRVDKLDNKVNKQLIEKDEPEGI